MKTSKILILLSLLSISIFAQSETQRQIEERQRQDDAERMRKSQAQSERREQTMNRNINAPPIYPKPVDKEELRQKQEAIAELNAQFAISEEYRNKDSVFLSQKNTGIAKMFPDTKCDVGVIVTVEELERCANVPQIKGNGSRYSIKFNYIPSNTPLGLIIALFGSADIYYNGNNLLFGNRGTQSIVGEIGDVNLDEITLKSPANKFLTDFKPSKTKTKFQEQTKILEKGVAANGYLYSTFASVKLNSVYVFRSITFSYSPMTIGRFFWEKDLFVAFKVIGKEDDGSIIFLWKKLKEKDAPYLENK